MKYLRITLLFLFGFGLSACDTGPKSAAGFRLPDGDTELGKQLFVDLQCVSCHAVNGIEDIPLPSDSPVQVVLGGEASPRVQNYGALVTSIINPSHRLADGYSPEAVAPGGQSLMKNYNDVLTVTQLSHLVSFLQGTYRIKPPPTIFDDYDE